MAHNQDIQSLKPLPVPKLPKQPSWRMKGTVSVEEYNQKAFAASWKRGKQR